MKTISTYIVVRNNGERFFCDDLDAARVIGRVCGSTFKGVYSVVLEVVAYEEIKNILYEPEPDWDIIAEKTKGEIANANQET